MLKWDVWKVRLTHRRILAVNGFSFLSGLPFGLLITGIPAWMAMLGIDIRTIGILSLAQAPYAFKFLWAPIFDRVRLPGFSSAARKRGWAAFFQLFLALLTFGCASLATSPPIAAVAALTLLIALSSASLDIVIDGYAVEVLEPAEVGIAVGSRTAAYRLAMWISGNLAITLSKVEVGGRPLGWGVTLAILGVLYLLQLPLTLRAPDPVLREEPAGGRGSAALGAFVDFLARPKALGIAAFLIIYKFSDNLALSLISPFLIEKGYAAIDVGVGTGTLGLIMTVLGTFLGGVATPRIGVTRAVFYFGVAQALANGGYAVLAVLPLSRVLLYGMIGFDKLVVGMATGAFFVLLFHLTRKRFSATQFALFSSLFALGRSIAGPLAGALTAAVGWRNFFLLTILTAIPGLILLRRTIPWRLKDLSEWEPPAEETPRLPAAWIHDGLAGRSIGLGLLATLTAFAVGALLRAAEGVRAGRGFAYVNALWANARCQDGRAIFDTAAALAVGLVVAFAVVGYAMGRRELHKAKE